MQVVPVDVSGKSEEGVRLNAGACQARRKQRAGEAFDAVEFSTLGGGNAGWVRTAGLTRTARFGGGCVFDGGLR